jgi:rhodanese-related sulfurtransferase
VVVPDGPPAQLAGATLVNTEQMAQMLKDREAGSSNFDLVDARGCTGEPIIPGSICLDPNTIEGLQDKIPDKTTELVIYCHDGKCPMSYNLASQAVSAGYTNVLWYRGGINAWMAAGNTTTTFSAAS